MSFDEQKIQDEIKKWIAAGFKSRQLIAIEVARALTIYVGDPSHHNARIRETSSFILHKMREDWYPFGIDGHA